jgi:menaquinone-dependent protoporphyrinogen oxidase
MKVLVIVASRYGATTEIADAIARTLSHSGIEVTMLPPGEVTTVADYDAVVLGSAVYAGRWQPAARDLVDRLARELVQRPVWLFSSGPVGDPAKPTKDAVDVTALLAATNAREHRMFAGKLVRGQLNFAERAVTAALRVRDSDARDWTEIAAWSGHIADQLRPLTAHHPEEGQK